MKIRDLDSATVAQAMVEFATDDAENSPDSDGVEHNGDLDERSGYLTQQIAEFFLRYLGDLDVDFDSLAKIGADGASSAAKRFGTLIWAHIVGHGIGFFDGDFGEATDELESRMGKLDEKTIVLGADPYIGDDGTLYIQYYDKLVKLSAPSDEDGDDD